MGSEPIVNMEMHIHKVLEAEYRGNEAGLRRGDVILEVDRKQIRDVKGLKDATAKIRDGKSVLFLVQRGETTLFLAMKSR